MDEEYLYHYVKSRKQRSWLFIRMAIACLVYILGLYGYEVITGETVSADFWLLWIVIFSVAALVCGGVAVWLRRNPATYEAFITRDRFVIRYPAVAYWSFDVALEDIERFESRTTTSHAGRAPADTGIVMKDGSFHCICMNYGNNIGEMHKVVQSVHPSVLFPKKLNNRFVAGKVIKDHQK